MSGIPFANHVGIKAAQASQTGGFAILAQAAEKTNHIGTLQAGGPCTLGKTASGAELRPMAVAASVEYLAIAKGTITGTGALEGDIVGLNRESGEAGRVRFPVNVTLRNEEGTEVTHMSVEWHLSKRRGG